MSTSRKTTTLVTPSQRHSGWSVEVAAIGLDLAVLSGGLSASGSVVPPAGRAIWVRGYNRVPPGDVGTSVIAGHVASYGRGDVFAELASVRIGHEVRITTGGVTRTFVVRRTAVVTKAGLTRDADVWGANASVRRIVLITCDDDLGYRRDGHRVANYVVVADAVERPVARRSGDRMAQ